MTGTFLSMEDFEIEVRDIIFPNKGGQVKFTVRGLNAVDLSYLISEHLQDIEAALVLLTEARAAYITKGSIDAVLMSLVRDAPGLMAEVISVAADQRDLAASKYAKLPFSVTVSALLQIWLLTMEDQGGLKNLLAVLASLVPESVRESVRSLKKQAETLSQLSTGESEQT